MLDVSINFSKLEKAVNIVKKLGNISSAGSVLDPVILSMAKAVEKEVKRRYRAHKSGGDAAALGRRMLRRGKDVGMVNQARVPMKPRGFGYLADAVIMRKYRNKYRVFIPAGIPFKPNNRTTNRKVAELFENPRPIKRPYTLRFHIYKKLIKEGKGGFNTKINKGRFIEKNKELGVDMWLPKRVPVWQESLLSVELEYVYGSGKGKIQGALSRYIKANIK
jgi:hypothetical protein